jgi:CBS domain-containing protein
LSAEGTGFLARIAVQALRPHPPFDTMADDALEWIGERASLTYFRNGEEIVGPASGVVDRLHIVRQGIVQLRAPADLPREELEDLVHGPGECFPVGALLGRRATAYHYLATGDVFTYELAAGDVRALIDASPPFRAFCTDRLAALVEQARRVLRTHAGEKVLDEGRLLAPLRDVCRGTAVACRPSTSIREALRTMRSRRVGSIVVVDGRHKPIGIMTHVDLLERVMLPEKSLDTPVGEVMTRPPETLDAGAPAYAAAQAMAGRGIRHIVVVADGRLFGVVSERDLYALQRASVGRAAKAIRHAADVPQLTVAAREVRELAGQLLAQGVDAPHLTAIVSSLNDSLVQAALRLAVAATALPGRYCWLAFGSEGRSEQTLASDQDNGLILEDGVDARPFLGLAAHVNQTLAACGFPLCKGGVMASNPRWCLQLGRWRATFSDWIRNPVPHALLDASIFFDLRPLAGEAQFAGVLREEILTLAVRHPAFLRAMTENSLQARPALGLLGGLGTTIDLKAAGSRIFVDAARVWALARGVPQTSTHERLLGAARAGALPEDEALAASQSFHVIQALRLRHQLLQSPAPGAENRVDAGAFGAVDRRVLKEALRHAARLQRRLRLDFAL